MTEKRAPGEGRIWLRGRIWWIRYSLRGKRFEESSRSTDRRNAVKLLRRRLGEIGTGRHMPDAERVTFDDLARMVETDYQLNGRQSLRRVERAFKRLREPFGMLRALDITADRLTAYASHRVADGAARATVAYELAVLRRGFSLAVRAGRLMQRPAFPIVRVDNARSGFFEAPEFQSLVKQLSGDPKKARKGRPELVAVITFAYLTGWRVKSEVLPLRWSQVDLDAGIVRLEPGTTKNREGRNFPVSTLPELADLLRERRRVTTETERRIGAVIPWVFHREGQEIKDFRDAWRRACKRAGVVGLIPHDLRRTAVRNFERAGVPRSVAMQLVGHKTASIYSRYAVTNERDLADGVSRLARLREADAAVPKTVLPLVARGQSGDNPAAGVSQ